MFSIKNILSGGFLLCSCYSLFASPISPAEALKRANGDVKKLSAYSPKENRLIHTANEGSQPAIYLFSQGEGFIALSAESEMPAILGWSDSPFNTDNLPPAFIAWMDEICKETAALRDGVLSAANTRAPQKDFEKIEPMCATRWNQSTPFNDMCPKDYKTGERTVTGCVATAMAQVMKYHNWPISGEGSVSYKCAVSTFGLRLDFSNQVYEWDKMLDRYLTNAYNEEEADAVANLMKSCGYSVEMDYATGGSGATSVRIGNALGKFFKYDKSTLRYAMRDYYSLLDWNEMIYNSLAVYGPIVLNGQSNQGGHSFVCDGYDMGGYFHINWGWGGISDGYFLLNALDPYNQGIGGSGDNSGFNFMQDAVLGITPAKDLAGNEKENGDDLWTGQLYSVGPMGLDITREYTQGEVTEPLCNEGVFNYGPSIIPETAGLGLIFRSNDENEEIYGILGQLGVDIELLTGFKDLELPLPTDVPDGKYLMTLSYCLLSEDGEDERWFDVLFPEGEKYYEAEVEGETIRFTTSSWRPSSIEKIESGISDTAPRYFNLQGMELRAPREGEIVIVKEGTKALKRRF